MENSFIIKADKIKYNYPDGHQALKDISVEISNGEKVAIIGPNGAGKSTLMFYMAGLIGDVESLEISGMKFNKANEKNIRNKIGFVFQDPDDQIFCLRVIDEVALGPLNQGLSKDIVLQRVKKALKILEIEGYEGRLCSHLSYGEKKRVCIASVLSCNPEILFLDEPTANLDLKRRRDLIRFINSCDKTMIIATHDLDLALEVTKRTVLINAGKLIKSGLSEDILLDEKLLLENDLELPIGIKSR